MTKQEATAEELVRSDGASLSPETMVVVDKLKQINQLVTALEPELKERAIALLLEQEFRSASRSPGSPGQEATPNATPATLGARVEFAGLVEKWTPANGNEWALLAAYHLSKEKVDGVVSGQEVNSVLKHHGVGRGNITKSIGRLINADPALMLQVRKDGTSRQARKSYKVTTSGIAFVESHLKGAGGASA